MGTKENFFSVSVNFLKKDCSMVFISGGEWESVGERLNVGVFLIKFGEMILFRVFLISDDSCELWEGDV